MTTIPEKENSKRALYRVILKTRPLPGHPQFWAVEFGCFVLWLFAESNADAANRAVTITEALNFEIVYQRVGTVKITESAKDERIAQMENDALHTGLRAMLVAWPAGADEDGFFDTDKFLKTHL